MDTSVSTVLCKADWRVMVRVNVRQTSNLLVCAPNGHVKGFDTQNDESTKRQLTDNIPLRDVIRTFIATCPTAGGFLTK